MRGYAAWAGAVVLALLVQTALIPPFVTEPWRPDFTRAIVLWLALTGCPPGGVYLSFLSGLAVDVASGGPPGFTAICRLAIYGLARPWRGVFELAGILFIIGPFAVMADILGVLVFKNSIYLHPPTYLTILSVGARQALVEIAAVPLAFWTLGRLTGYRPDETPL